MATDQKFADFVAGQLANAGEISLKKMFGEYGVYCGGKMVASVCDNQLFVKPTEAGLAFWGENPPMGIPYAGAKPQLAVNDRIDDSEWLAELVKITFAALPEPKPKKKK